MIINKLISTLWGHYRKDSLYRNSVHLMLATAVMAVFGFLFWLLNARLFSAENIGLATTLISVTNLIGALSIVGFDAVFVRFLPKDEKKDDQISTGFILVGMAAVAVACLFVLLVPIVSPQIGFIASNPATALMFVIFCVMFVMNGLTDAIFLAYRQTIYTLSINTAFSIIRMILPFAFVRYGAWGIFSAAAVAQTVGFVLSIAVIIKKLGYRPRWVVDRGILKKVWKYSGGNYVSDVLSLIPPSVLPVIITNRLGPQLSAYFYIDMMIANLLYVIPQSVTRSLFAEGSHEELEVGENIRKSIRIISLFLAPAILVLTAGGGAILKIFGKDYSAGGYNLLVWVTLAAIPVTAFSIYGTLFRISHNLSGLMIRNATYVITVVGLVYLLLPMGLPGVGLALMSGYILTSLVSHLMQDRGQIPAVDKMSV